MGRGYGLPSVLEGAPKLKDISCIHAEGYGAAERKRDPIAYITDHVLMICVRAQNAIHEKVLSKMQEIRARGDVMLAIAPLGDEEIAKHCADVIHVPERGEPFSPIVIASPFQLFAYHIALNGGCDVVRPRNLAKSVTVYWRLVLPPSSLSPPSRKLTGQGGILDAPGRASSQLPLPNGASPLASM